MSSYVNVAEYVLRCVRRPLTPKEILNWAYLHGLVPAHLHGRTQHKTLHARLSEDISHYLEDSRFYRTAPGRFFLRELADDPSTPPEARSEFFAPPRRKELKREAILAIHWPSLVDNLEFCEVTLDAVDACIKRGDFAYLQWRNLQHRPEYWHYSPVHSFVIVHQAGMALSYRCGKFRPQSDPIRGMRSVGFGGAVFWEDEDMLYDSFHGVVGNGINELVYGLGLPRRMAEDARYSHKVERHFGAFAEAKTSKLRHLQIVLSYECPEGFLPTKAALSLNDLRWVDVANPTNRIDDYDDTSKYLFEHGRLRGIAGIA